MRLDRLMTMLAQGSRSQVRDLIRRGRISIDGAVARAPEQHVGVGCEIRLDGQILDARTVRHVMLHKPCGVLTAARDPKQPTVLDLLPPAFAACQCMPVGRLDKDTSGLLLLTTDGALSHLLLSPRRHVWKCYEAEVDGPLTDADAEAFAKGVVLSDFTALPARMEIVSSGQERAVALVWVREGKYHQVRRMFAARGRTVTKLKRTVFGPLRLDPALDPGEYRELTEEELRLLRAAVSEEGTRNE